MDAHEELERIKLRLDIAEQTHDAALFELFIGLYELAIAKCNRAEATPALLAIVRDAVCCAYRRRGDEGSVSASVGGQSQAYADIEEKMFRDLLLANQRLVRL